MALFKIYKGTNDLLEKVELHEGYAYFIEDTHKLYIDTDTERICLSAEFADSALEATSAQKLSKEIGGETVTVEIEDIVTKSGSFAQATNAVVVLDAEGKLTAKSTSKGAAYATGNDMPIQFGTLPVEEGGTGVGNIPSGAILRGNGTSAVSSVSGVGALYAASEGNPQFGTLPITQGGTGATTAEGARENLNTYSTNEIDLMVAAATGNTFHLTLTPSDWSASGVNLTKTVFVDSSFVARNMPIIFCEENLQEYKEKLVSADANSDNKTITFTISASLVNDVKVGVIDIK